MREKTGEEEKRGRRGVGDAVEHRIEQKECC